MPGTHSFVVKRVTVVKREHIPGGETRSIVDWLLVGVLADAAARDAEDS